MYEEEKIAMRVIGCGILILALIAAIIVYDAMPVEAKSIGDAYTTWEGDTHLSHYGYVKIQGQTYYSHYSKSAMYDRGEVTRNAYRVRGEKMYYFGEDGAMQKKSTKYIKLHRNGSVKYIYMPSSTERYNCDTHRYQVRRKGKWEDTGMQCYPYGLIDWQW